MDGSEGWRSLKKGPVQLHLSYGGTFSNNCYARNCRLRSVPAIELQLDLDGNLKGRPGLTNTYEDARELADGAIGDLVLVEFDDPTIATELSGLLVGRVDAGPTWRLTIMLEGSRSFDVAPTIEPGPDPAQVSLRVLGPSR